MKHNPQTLKRHTADPDVSVEPGTEKSPDAAGKAEPRSTDDSGAHTRETSGWAAGGQPTE